MNRPVLLVEDNDDDVFLVTHAFKKAGVQHPLAVAQDGQEAIDFLVEAFKDSSCEKVPALILLDLKMPKVNGIEVLKKIKTDTRTKTIPIVILTSSREDPDIQACYELGVNSYVVKPVDFEAFVKSVNDLGLYWMLLNQPPA